MTTTLRNHEAKGSRTNQEELRRREGKKIKLR
jgi:hypothetical protein